MGTFHLLFGYLKALRCQVTSWLARHAIDHFCCDNNVNFNKRRIKNIFFHLVVFRSFYSQHFPLIYSLLYVLLIVELKIALILCGNIIIIDVIPVRYKEKKIEKKCLKQNCFKYNVRHFTSIHIFQYS